MKVNRGIFIITTFILFIIEVIIAIYKFNPFIRNTIGDILVVILIWTFFNIFFHGKVKYLSLYVFIFACFTEMTQYFNLVEILGLQNNKLMCAIIGTTFSWSDIIAYAIGCLLVVTLEILSNTNIKDNIIFDIKSIIFHTPKHALNEIQKEQIRKYGLVHFTYDYNLDSIMENGLIADSKKAMTKDEIGFVWLYINNPEEFIGKMELVHHKGDRKNYNAYVTFKELSSEQIDQLLIRSEVDNAVVYRGVLKTTNMKGELL